MSYHVGICHVYTNFFLEETAMIDVALCADRTIIPGLHVTIASMLLNEQSGPLRIHLVHDGFPAHAMQAVEETIRLTGGGKQVTLHQYPLVPDSLAGLPAFQGSRMAYARILLPALIPDAERIAYLDCDIIITCPVSGFAKWHLEDKPLGAVPWTTAGASPDRQIFQAQGMDKTDPVYASGQLVMDAAAWRREGLSEALVDYGRRHLDRIQWGNDQTLINLFFAKQIATIDKRYCSALWPNTEPVDREGDTGFFYHLVGAPKPWDFLGEKLHRNSSLYLHYLDQTSLKGYRSWQDLSFAKYRRTFLLSKNYLRLFAKRLKARR